MESTIGRYYSNTHWFISISINGNITNNEKYPSMVILNYVILPYIYIYITNNGFTTLYYHKNN